MAFVLNQSATYTWPVKITLAISGGKREVSTFDAEFKRLPQTRINEIMHLIREQEVGRRQEDLMWDTDVCRELLSGWDGVNDDDGKPVPFSEGSLNKLLDIPTVASQVIRTWAGSLEDAKRKN
jgi:hypothetical protein